jgi:hypothetical protein
MGGDPVKIRRLLRSTCPNRLTCPNIYELEDGRLLVQGDKATPELLAELGVPAHETLVVVPRALIPGV